MGLAYPSRPARLAALVLAASVLTGGFVALAGAAPPAPARAMPAQSIPYPHMVTVYRDEFGVPHIYGETAEAAAFALGYVQAEDHLLALRIKYYQAGGQTASRGLGTASGDKLSYLLHVPQTAQAVYAALPPASRAYIDAFVAGLNRYIEGNGASLPGWVDVVEPWEPLAWMHYAQILEQRQIALEEIARATAVPAPQPAEAAAASNMWAVAPSGSAAGVAMLHGDPHLPYTGLLQWYEVHLNYPGVSVGGAVPFGHVGVAMGSSDDLAWTMTSNAADTADVYQETLNPSNPLQYWYDGAWRDMTVEVVTINGLPYTNLYTHHGPVLSTQGNTAYAARMASFDIVDDPVALTENWASASSVDAFRDPTEVPILSKWHIIAADRGGNIFYRYNIRAAHKSEAYNWTRPVDGTTTATEWGPWLTVGELPQSLNPARGYLQNANNPPWSTAPELDPADFPSYLAGSGTSLGDRGTRAVELLEADTSMTIDEMKVMGMDDLTVSGRNVTPLLVQTWAERGPLVPDPDGSLALAMGLIGAWDYFADVDERAYAVYLLWFEAFFALNPSFKAASPPPFSGLPEADKDKMVQALQSAVAEAKSKVGSVDRPWGEVHVIDRGGRFPVGGGNRALPALRMANVDAFSGGAWTASSGSSYMFVVAFTDPVQFWSVRPLGQSEDPASPHYNDQTALYGQNQYKRLWMTLPEVISHAQSSSTSAYYGPDPDVDGDGWSNYLDNCPLVANPAQQNSDSGPAPSGSGGIGNGRGIPGDDATIANGDALGDLCDDDLDNDGIPNAPDADPGGDITYDDNNDGVMLNAADDGPSWDRDGNGVRDGVEGICPLALNPAGDDDGDGLLNTWEVCKWGSDPALQDSDGDGLKDCVEAADVNGDAVVDFVGDVIYYAKAVLLPATTFGRDGDFDINGDGTVDFVGDVIQEAKYALNAGLCQ